jgi:hypothetical protein
LLHNVRQFMGQQPVAGSRPRLIPPRGKNDVAPDRIGHCIDGARGFRGAYIRMNPHLTEVVAEAGFHESTGIRVKRPARGVQHVMHNGGNHGLFMFDDRAGLLDDLALVAFDAPFCFA